MANPALRRLTLAQSATYEIKVSGHLDESWSEWGGDGTKVAISRVGRSPVSTIAGTFDQAALHGLLRRLYSLGFPLISVNWIEDVPNDIV